MGDETEWLKLPTDEKCVHKVGAVAFCRLTRLAEPRSSPGMEGQGRWLRGGQQAVQHPGREEPRVLQIPRDPEEDGDGLERHRPGESSGRCAGLCGECKRGGQVSSGGTEADETAHRATL